MKKTIELPESHVVTKGPRDKSWQAECKADIAKLPDNILADLAIHGLHQKIADAASQAKTLDEANALMSKALDALYEGEWTRRGEGLGSAKPETVALIRLVRAALSKADRKAFNELSGSDMIAKAEEFADKFTDEMIADEMVVMEAEAEARRAANERKAKLAKAVKINL